MTQSSSVDALFPEQSVVAICPLNWGLGHASRCIPLIHLALKKGNEVIIASDGQALVWLKREFPQLKFYELPSYNVSYPYTSIVLNAVSNFYRITSAIFAERKMMETIIRKEKIHFLLSDNRYGLQTVHCKTAFMCHQMHIYHPKKWLSKCINLVHQFFLKRSKSILIPDFEQEPGLAGLLSHQMPLSIRKRAFYTGPLTNLKIETAPNPSGILILLSGPEPQRTLLEDKLIDLFENTGEVDKITLIRGTEKPLLKTPAFRKIIDLASSELVNQAINESKAIICRSGYSTIMDLHNYQGKILYIPTPGQTEQEYLSQLHADGNKVFQVNQSELNEKHLEELLNQ